MNGTEASRRRIGMVAAAVLLALGVVVSLRMNEEQRETVYRPVRDFSNMCGYEGKVYCGVNGAYGEPVAVQSSVFTIWDGKVYYVDKVQEAYDSMTDELLTINRCDLDGGNVETLAEDVFLAGAGHEKLVGDRLFYGYGYDENYRMQYACVDVNTKKRTEIASDRIDEILGYDGNYLYYNGYDTGKEEPILGRISLQRGKDETLASYAETDEEGYIDSMSFADGKLYCFTLLHKTDGYDYRTYEYGLQIRNAENGKVEREVPVRFTGSANYSFLVSGEEVFVAADGEIIAVSLTETDGSESSERKVAALKEAEYWGILHFIPGDGYLYYEAIAEADEETGNNDYFYRVPIEGGEPELLKEWFTV